MATAIRRDGPPDFFGDVRRSGFGHSQPFRLTDPQFAMEHAETHSDQQLFYAPKLRARASYNPKRDILPAFSSVETGKEYPLSPHGMKSYAKDAAEYSYVNQYRLVRVLKDTLMPVPGSTADIDIDRWTDSLEVLI